MTLNKKSLFAVFVVFLFSKASFAQSSFDPFKAKPTFGPGCSAKNIDEAKGWLNLSYLTDVAYYARQKCGWNFDPTVAAKFELLAHTTVIGCYGEATATKIEKEFQTAAAITGSRCNAPDILSMKKEYAEKIAILSQ